jgi:hypothetical protein
MLFFDEDISKLDRESSLLLSVSESLFSYIVFLLGVDTF